MGLPKGTKKYSMDWLKPTIRSMSIFLLLIIVFGIYLGTIREQWSHGYYIDKDGNYLDKEEYEKVELRINTAIIIYVFIISYLIASLSNLIGKKRIEKKKK